MTRKKKRTFQLIRKQILKELKKGEKTVNEIATSTNTEWRSINNHLIYLTGMGKIEPVIQTKYVRVYRLAEGGK